MQTKTPSRARWTCCAARSHGAPRKPREGTKQEVVLAMLRRPEGATVAQIAEATGWAQHTVRGFFAGLKKRQGITVENAERIRQVGPNKQGAKGSYTVDRVAE
jgi:predicted ArsR family transcriptional regulator